MLSQILVICLIYLLVRCYLWYRRRINIFMTFKRNGIKGPKPALISGNFYQFKENPNQTLDEWIEEYGNVFGYFYGDRPILVVNDLDTIRDILVKKSRIFRDRPKFILNIKPMASSLLNLRGDRWRHVRRVMTSPLAHHKINSKEITDILNDSTDICISKIEEKNESVVKVGDRMQSITLDIVCKCVLNMFGTDVHEDDSQLKNAAKDYMDSAKNMLVLSAAFLPFIRPVLQFIHNYLTAGRMADTILRHLNKQIEIETENISSNPQYLEKTNSVNNNNVLKSLLKSYFTQNLERDEVTGNAIILLLAGYDTTSMGLTFALYCLAKNQDIQERLRYEISLDGCHSSYLDWVWNETLRLFPPVATLIQRVASEDIVVDGIAIEKETSVQIPIWHIHHDPNIWPDPEKFDPQRFSPENREQRHSASFLAFGLGPRNCIGMELAAQEARLILTKLISKFRIEVCDQTPETIEFICPTDILYPKHPIYLRFIKLN